MPAEGTPGRSGYGALVASVIGLAVSVYLTIEHFTASSVFACPESATINCAKVTTSRWSHVAGIPVAVLGVVYFVVLTALCLPMAWRVPWLDPWRLAVLGVGTLSVIGLVYVELFEVDAICLWCTAVHVCTVVALACCLWHRAVHEPEP